MKGTQKYPMRGGLSSMKITVPVFGERCDDGTLKKQIALVERGRYTFPGLMLLKIWTAQPLQRTQLINEKHENYRGVKGKWVSSKTDPICKWVGQPPIVYEKRNPTQAKYLLRLKRTKLVEEAKDGFRVTATFKPWMVTGVKQALSKFKPSVPGLLDTPEWLSQKASNHFSTVHAQARQHQR
jgi:hypothetical protein